jgi:hypothetical protein
MTRGSAGTTFEPVAGHEFSRPGLLPRSLSGPHTAGLEQTHGSCWTRATTVSLHGSDPRLGRRRRSRSALRIVMWPSACSMACPSVAVALKASGRPPRRWRLTSDGYPPAVPAAAPALGAQRLISSWITCVNPAAFCTPGIAPMVARRSFIAGEAIAFCSSASSRCSTAGGVPAGASTPNQDIDSKPGRPLSLTVGSSGAAGVRGWWR